MTHRTPAEIALSERANRLAALLARVEATKRALDARDYDALYALVGDVGTLAGMLVDATERVAEAGGGMSQPMALMTSNNTDEWYTPPWVLELAREVLGGIDLDPASSAQANAAVQAARFYTQADDGYMQPWAARSLWLNPPFSETARWVRRLSAAVADGDVSAALLLVNSAPGYTWYEELVDQWPAVQLRKRLAFVRADGGTNKDKGGLAKKSQTLVYFGQDVARFEAVFAPYGRRLHTAAPRPRGLFDEAAERAA